MKRAIGLATMSALPLVVTSRRTAFNTALSGRQKSDLIAHLNPL